jgi:uncharacterized repeat protein (TIGR02543 family)
MKASKKLWLMAALFLTGSVALAQPVNFVGITGDCMWRLTGPGDSLTLTIEGNGDMGNYADTDWAPWDYDPYAANLKAVVIVTGVTSIGSCAFYRCTNLTSVTIPASVTSIGNNAFYQCRGLTSVTIPASVTSIGESAFYECKSLTSVTIPESVTSIGESAFEECWNLTSITIPASVTSIDNGVFQKSGLTSITIPASVTSIGESAFYHCQYLTSVTFSSPASVTSIGKSAFYECKSLTSITIPTSVTSIGESAFYECKSLTSITIPASVTSIGDYAFYKGGLDFITFTSPASLTSIGAHAFYGNGLTSIAFPASLTSIGDSAFANNYNLKSVTSHSTDPNSIGFGAGVFDGIVSGLGSVSLIVPPSSVGSYDTAEVWKDFKRPILGGVWLTVAANDDAQGSVTGTASGLYHKGATVTLRANPIKGYRISSWTSGSANFGNADILNVILTQDMIITANFEVDTYYITYIMDGGVNDDSNPATYTVRDSIPLQNPTRPGYGFIRWRNIDSITVTAIAKGSAGDTTFYAEWTAEGYTITFVDAQLDTVSLPVTYDAPIGALPEPTCDGYSFKGWYTEENGGGVQYAVDTVYRIAGDTTLYAQWTVNVYTITFNAQDGTGSHSDQSVTYGTAIGTLPEPTRDGYTFIGWFTEVGGGTQYVGGMALYSTVDNTTLYAQWTANVYTIKFNANAQGDVSPPPDQSVTYGAKIGQLPVPVRKGYEFGGWYTGGGVQYTVNTRIASDIILHAKWASATYTLTFDPQDGTVSPASKTVTYGKAVDTLPVPTRSGYVFAGWYTEPDGKGTQYKESDLAESNAILYAKWAATYTLTFSAGSNGTVSPASKTVTSGAAVGTLPTPTPTRSGYTFKGWYTEENGDGTQYTANTMYNTAGAMTLHAQWTAPTGVEDQLQVAVTLYPNPFVAEVRLTGAEGCTLTVFTAEGASIHTQKMSGAEETIALENLPSGLYFFRLEKNGKTRTVKAYKR